MAAAAAAFGVERHRRYGTGSSDPETPSKCELARAAGRLGQWTGEVTRAAAAETGVEAVRPNQNETQLVLALGARTNDPLLFLFKMMIEFAKTGSGQSRGKPFKTNMAFVAGKEAAFDRIFLSEDVIHDGQLVANYTVDACSGATGDKRPPPPAPPSPL